MRYANIFDPIQEELDQAVFDGTEPRPRVKNFIKKVYYRELTRELGLPDPQNLVDLYITGSLTTYQWGETSDCDVSVFPNFEEIEARTGMGAKEVRKRLISMSIDKIDGTFLPGTTHPLQFFVVSQENRPGDLYQPGLRSAYSLDDEMWLVEPEPERVHDIAVELPELYKRANDMADKMSQMLDHDPDQARELWMQVHMKRQLDQRAGLGDFSEGNIVYKYMLHEGLFDRIRNELHEYIAKIGRKLPEGLRLEIDHDTTTDNGDPAYACRAFIGEQLIGILRVNADDNIVAGLGVAKDYRRMGIATAMWYALLEEGYSPKHDEYGMTEDAEAWRQSLSGNNKLHEYIAKTAAPEDWVLTQDNFVGPTGEPYNFQMPLAVEQGFVARMECPQCGNHLLKENAEIWCPYCGWQPREAKKKKKDDSSLTEQILEQAKELETELTEDEAKELSWAAQEEFLTIDKQTHLEIAPGEYKPDNSYKFVWLPQREMLKVWQDDEYGIDSHNVQDMKVEGHIGMLATMLGIRDPYAAWWEDEHYQAFDKLLREEPLVMGYIRGRGGFTVQVSGNRTNIEPKNLNTVLGLPSDTQVDVISYGSDDAPKLASPFDNVTLKVIYDFAQDRIILGTQAEASSLASSKIIGTYDGRKVVLEAEAEHWINANYFRRLWAYSYPTRPLEEVSFKHGMEDEQEIVLPTRPPKRRNKAAWQKHADVEYHSAWVMVGAPYNVLLWDGTTTEHMLLIQDWLEGHDDPETVEDLLLSDRIPLAFGHVGYQWVDAADPNAAQYYWKVYSDYFRGMEPSARLVMEAVRMLKQEYPNITEYIGRERWWLGG